MNLSQREVSRRRGYQSAWGTQVAMEIQPDEAKDGHPEQHGAA